MEQNDKHDSALAGGSDLLAMSLSGAVRYFGRTISEALEDFVRLVDSSIVSAPYETFAERFNADNNNESVSIELSGVRLVNGSSRKPLKGTLYVSQFRVCFFCQTPIPRGDAPIPVLDSESSGTPRTHVRSKMEDLGLLLPIQQLRVTVPLESIEGTGQGVVLPCGDLPGVVVADAENLPPGSSLDAIRLFTDDGFVHTFFALGRHYQRVYDTVSRVCQQHEKENASEQTTLRQDEQSQQTAFSNN